jgi:hypothetical protein
VQDALTSRNHDISVNEHSGFAVCQFIGTVLYSYGVVRCSVVWCGALYCIVFLCFVQCLCLVYPPLPYDHYLLNGQR